MKEIESPVSKRLSEHFSLESDDDDKEVVDVPLEDEEFIKR